MTLCQWSWQYFGTLCQSPCMFMLFLFWVILFSSCFWLVMTFTWVLFLILPLGRWILIQHGGKWNFFFLPNSFLLFLSFSCIITIMNLSAVHYSIRWLEDDVTSVSFSSLTSSGNCGEWFTFVCLSDCWARDIMGTGEMNGWWYA